VSRKKGLPLSLGHIQYTASWQTPRTDISVSLKEDNYYVLCVIEYWSRDYAYLSGEVNKEDRIDPF
jgi:hypothetical protein